MHFSEYPPDDEPTLLIMYIHTAPHSEQAKENVMHYKKAAEEGTHDSPDQIKAKKEEINTASFTSSEYATLCRGNTSKVPVLSRLVAPQKFTTLETGRVASRSCLWDRYWGQNGGQFDDAPPVTRGVMVPQATARCDSPQIARRF